MEEVEEGKAQREICTLTFNIYFEEIWDFYLTFMDWKSTIIKKPKHSTVG